jgi:hypothetical protein
MLSTTKKFVKPINRLPFTIVNVAVTDESGNRIDGLKETFIQGKEVQMDAWIENKEKIFREQYPALCASKQDLYKLVQELTGTVATLTQALKDFQSIAVK